MFTIILIQSAILQGHRWVNRFITIIILVRTDRIIILNPWLIF